MKVLTNRELEVLSLIAKGYTTNSIASMLFIHMTTIKTHRKHLLKKTGSSNIAELIY